MPDSLHKKFAELAEREGVSIDQLINSAVAEKMSALMPEEYLEARAKRGSRWKFDSALAKVADIEPEESDRIPSRPGKASLIAPLSRSRFRDLEFQHSSGRILSHMRTLTSRRG